MPGTYTSITLPPLSQLLPQLLPHPLSLSYSPIHIYMSPDYPSPRIWHDVPFMPGTLITPLLSYSPIHIYVPEPYRRSAIYMHPDYPLFASGMTCPLCQVLNHLFLHTSHFFTLPRPPLHVFMCQQPNVAHHLLCTSLTFTHFSLKFTSPHVYVPSFISMCLPATQRGTRSLGHACGYSQFGRR